ncbi:hypothetical protein A1O3_00947 [Capronia epimyces CBS 606.96]|uniref:Uncharacterized protein n=1 Tax=Capronia epimyces CBS 606.96 TaxID=1182542 RepID=W9YHQ7_9EURO|nr:uncharacterized protein A1O3_00947 [Capronia epimyces CBS 606.96]EXJ92397.1 hypothetical protein A1O3_00947 [Capronia epimyces CBS 606.96]
MVIARPNGSGKLRSRFDPNCVKGFIFLGTPHEGSELMVFAKAMSLFGHWQGSSSTLLEVLDHRSQENRSLHHDFLTGYGSTEMVNFYEVMPECMGPFPIMNAVSKDSASIPGKFNIPCPGTHRNIHRFMSDKELGYIRLRERITNLVNDNILLKYQGSILQDMKTFSDHVESVFQQEFRVVKINREAIKWFLESPEYYGWLSSNEARFLWYSGPPGSGKTTTSLEIVNQLEEKYSFRTRLAYFFCSHHSKISLSTPPQRITSVALVTAITSQFIGRDNFPNLPTDIQAHLSAGHRPTENDHEVALWKALQTMLFSMLTENQEVRIVLDGIDELPRAEMTRFLRSLRDIWDTVETAIAGGSKRLKILIVSRPFKIIQDIMAGLPSINPEKESTDCLNSLAARADNERRGLVSLGEKETGAWLWVDDTYKDWNDSKESALLWIQGKPGSGKSTLSKKLLSDIMSRHKIPDRYGVFTKKPVCPAAGTHMSPNTSTVLLASFFYSLRGAKSEISNTQMLQSLLYQLLDQERRLYPIFRETYRKLLAGAGGRAANIDWSFDNLHHVFASLAKFEDFHLEVYLVIDGMDEAEKSERDRILSLLEHFGDTGSKGRACIIKYVLASRPQDDIKDSLLDRESRKGFFHLILEQKNEEDIKSFIRVKMVRLQKAYRSKHSSSRNNSTSMASFEDVLRDAADYLAEKARGVFLWVEIVTNELKRCVDTGYIPIAIKKTLHELPEELEEFYERIINDLLARFEEKGKRKIDDLVREARQMLTWATFAERPLTVEEFRHAIAIPATVEENSGIDLSAHLLPDHSNVKLRIAHVCGDLLEIIPMSNSSGRLKTRDHEDIIQLLHRTVRDFLTRDSRAGQFSMKRPQGEYEIFVNCISYLRLFTERCPQICLDDSDDTDDAPTAVAVIRYLRDWPLLFYIFRFLPRHLQNSGDKVDQARNIGAEFAESVMRQEGTPASWLLASWFERTGLLRDDSLEGLGEADDFRLLCNQEASFKDDTVDVAATLLELEAVSTAATSMEDDNDLFWYVLYWGWESPRAALESTVKLLYKWLRQLATQELSAPFLERERILIYRHKTVQLLYKWLRQLVT